MRSSRRKGASASPPNSSAGRPWPRLVQARARWRPGRRSSTRLNVARVLAFLHARGLAHGRVDPSNVFVTDGGLTRLADLGLTLTPSAFDERERRETSGPIELVGPGRDDLSPEAVRDDLRGLGRTLEALITGRLDAPSGDAQALVARGVPANLVELISGLSAARPDGPFADASKAAGVLEQLLNARRPGTTTPKEEHTKTLEDAVARFRASPSARLKHQLVLGSGAFCLALFLLGLVAGRYFFAASVAGLVVMAGAFSLALDRRPDDEGLRAKSRRLLFQARPADLLSLAFGGLVFLTGLWVFELLGLWVFFGIVALGFALALRLYLDRRVETERRPAVDDALGLVKTLRGLGVAEDAIRRFVRVTAGGDWPSVVEALFGHATVQALSDSSTSFWRGGLRDLARVLCAWVEGWVEGALETQRKARERPLLEGVEERGMVASGINLLTARRRSWRIAEAMLAVSGEIRAADRGASDVPADHQSVAKAIRSAVETPEQVLVERERGLAGPNLSTWVNLLIGPRTRFLLGSVVLAGFFLWVHQNGIVSGEQLRDVALKTIESPDHLEALKNARIDVRTDVPTRPLDVKGLPGPLARFFNGFHAGAAGLILVLSAFVRGSRVGLFALPGAAVALVWPAFGLPGAGPLGPSALGSAVGAGVASLGLFLGEAEGD
ncbi:MAG: hypothetical protein U0835_18100 [Isosphaeraceae bacterium]